MALLNFNFESKYLNGNTEICIILPDRDRSVSPSEFYSNGEKYKALWLLHGTLGDCTDWVRKSMIELYACENNLVVIMPSALNSDYANWSHFADGYLMYDYFFQELMPLIYGWFPVSDKKEDNFIAGLSMGGTGVMKFALTHPEKFEGAAVLSSSPRQYPEDYDTASPMRKVRMDNMISEYGSMEEMIDSYENTWKLAEESVGDPLRPKFYFSIGDEDLSFDRFERFHEHAREIGFDAEFEVIHGFKHEWRLWDITIQHALKYFGFKIK